MSPFSGYLSDELPEAATAPSHYSTPRSGTAADWDGRSTVDAPPGYGTGRGDAETRWAGTVSGTAAVTGTGRRSRDDDAYDAPADVSPPRRVTALDDPNFGAPRRDPETSAAPEPENVDSGDAGPAPTDAGYADAGYTNAGYTHAGYTNAGYTNAGYTDAGPAASEQAVAGYADPAPTDAEHPDPGHTGSGHTGSGHTDAGHTDAGHTDAGHTDAGHTDAGHTGASSAAPVSPAPGADLVTAGRSGRSAGTLVGSTRSDPDDDVHSPLRPGDVAQTRITLWDDEATRQFHEEWHEVKAQFVDDPVTALTRAHDLLTEAVHELTDALLAERDDLDPLRRTSAPDTESMRMAMRGYREFLDRILAL